MPKLKGQILFTGKIGDLVVYERNGELIVRRKPASTSKAWKTAPSYKRSRENSKEFGGSAKMAAWFRKQLINCINQDKDGTLNNRLVKNLQQMIKLGEGERGRRAIQWNQLQEIWENFRINGTENDRFPVQQSFKISTNENQIVLDSFNLDPKQFPKGTTHFQCSVKVLRLKDAIFNESNDAYEIKELPNLLTEFTTEMKALNDVNVPTSIFDLIPGNYAAMVDVGFFQEVNGEYFKLKAHPCQIVRVVTI